MKPDEGNGASARGWIKLAVLLVVIVGASVLVRRSGLLDSVTIAEIYSARDSAGAWAPLAFVGIYVVGTLVAFPGLVLTLSGGLLFGTAFGSALVLVGASIGAIGAFLISRYAGRSTVARFLAGGKLEQFDRSVAGSGFSAVLFTRLVPVFPFNVVNFAWGLSSVSLRDYALGTAIGIIPAVLVYANIAASIGRSLTDADKPLASIDYKALVNGDVGVAFALLGVLAAVPPIIRFVQRRRRSSTDRQASDE